MEIQARTIMLNVTIYEQNIYISFLPHRVYKVTLLHVEMGTLEKSHFN